MKITPDTNVLVRVLVRDDPVQVERAEQALHEATAVALTIPALCELVWVLRSVYQRDAHEGLHMGAERFISFDRQAVSMLRAQGVEAALL